MRKDINELVEALYYEISELNETIKQRSHVVLYRLNNNDVKISKEQLDKIILDMNLEKKANNRLKEWHRKLKAL